MKETQERRDAETRALQKDLLEYKEQMKNSLEEVCCILFVLEIPSSQVFLVSNNLGTRICAIVTSILSFQQSGHPYLCHRHKYS